MSAKKIKYHSSFQQAFTKEFPCIISSKKGSTFAMCTVCNCEFSVAHGGKTDVVKHVNTKKHLEKAASIEKNEKISFFAETRDQKVIKAECLFTAFLLEHNLPLSVADHAAPLFKKMFPDSEIAKKYSCARTKTTAIVKEMAFDFKNSVIESLKTSPFSISTDGSNSSNAKLYPIVVNFFNKKVNKVECALLSVPNLVGDATGVNIAQLLIAELEKSQIPLSNCLALGADNAPVMMGLKAGVAGILKSKNPNIEVIGCTCHLINLAADKGASCLPLKIEEHIIDIYYYLEKSAKRKEKLMHFQQLHNTEVKKILKHVCTRWLSLNTCLVRILDQWNPLLSFFKEEVKVSSKKIKSSVSSFKIPKKNQSNVGTSAVREHNTKLASKCMSKVNNKRKLEVDPAPELIAVKDKSLQVYLSREERIFLFLSSNINKAFCMFLRFVLPSFDIVNKTFQSAEPKIHVLYNIIRDFYKDMLSKFVKPSVILSCASVYDVNYSREESQKDDNDLIIGSATFNILQELSDDEKKEFFLHVRKYFCRICDYVRHKFPLKNEVVLHAKVACISNFHNANFADVKFFLNRFPSLVSLYFENNFDDDAVDRLQQQFCMLQLEDLTKIKEFERIDIQWSHIGELKSADGRLKYEQLSKVMLAILTIPHSNAECERVFSLVTKTNTKFRSNFTHDTLEKLLLAKTSVQGCCYEQTFQESFLKRAKSAANVHNSSLHIQ